MAVQTDLSNERAMRIPENGRLNQIISKHGKESLRAQVHKAAALSSFHKNLAACVKRTVYCTCVRSPRCFGSYVVPGRSWKILPLC